MKCNYCGNEFNSGNFCPHCGATTQNDQTSVSPTTSQNYYQNQNQNQNRNIYSGPSMVQKRSIATCIILSLVTCGIYGIFWFINLTNDTKCLSNDATCPSGGTAFLFCLLTFGIYGIYWAYKQGERIDAARTSKGLAPTNQGAIYIIFSVIGLGIVAYALMQKEINDLA